MYAEVISVKDDYTIECKLLSSVSTTAEEVISAKPLSINDFVYPLNGELVILTLAPSPSYTTNNKSYTFYYTLLPVKNQHDSNIVSNISKKSYSNATSNDNGIRSSKLQINAGESFILGRLGTYVLHGNSKNKYQEYVNDDKSFISLSSTEKNSGKINIGFGTEQKIKLNAKDALNLINDSFKKSLILLQSNSILIQSQRNSIRLDSSENISIAARNNVGIESSNITLKGNTVNLGNSIQTEPAILGQTLVSLLRELLTTLSSLQVIVAGAPGTLAPTTITSLLSISARLNTLLSRNVNISKTNV